MVNKRRQMIFVPEINPNSFLLLFQSGDSWSLRDYSVENRPAGPRYAAEFGDSLDDLWSKVVYHCDAPPHRTTDLRFWFQHTAELNRIYLSGESDNPRTPISRRKSVEPRSRKPFPIIDRQEFDQHRKAQKPHDLERILFSRNSEDWVTWTAFRLLRRSAPQTWWINLITLARAYNSRLSLPAGWEQTPEISLWETVASPAGYERALRERMRNCDNPLWVARAYDPRPVEGLSEIDVILRNDALVVFAEAKLGGDIALGIKYDPHRNQIARNIDCVLDQAGGRMPLFWMIVRDAGQGRAYTQLLRQYREDPDTLVRELGHHRAERVVALAANLSLILWKDVIAQIVQCRADDDERLASIKDELQARV